MRVALIGTHGTGKTTIGHDLVAQLKKQNINAEFLKENARACPFPINEERTKEAQEWLMYNQYTNELEMQSGCDVLICDRSVLDAYAYFSSKFGENELMEMFVKEKVKNYDLLFRVPKTKDKIESDGTRSEDPRFQSKIDVTFDYLLNKLEIPHNNYKDLNTTLNLIENGR